MSSQHVGKAIGLAAAIIVTCIAVLAAFDPIATLRGWLAVFVWMTMAPVGALALLVIHRITGGEWGVALASVLEPMARAILPVVLLSPPVFLFAGLIYRWGSPDMPAPVAHSYMNAPFFALRGAIALALWSLFAWFPSLRSTTPRAAVVLLVLGIITNIIPVDWVVAAQPGFYSSGFGFGFGIEQIFAALAVAAIVGPQGEDARECRDLAGLLVTALLGVLYFTYVQFAIIWYGNIPEKAVWYVIRGRFPWPAIGLLAFALAALFPFIALLNQEVRQSVTMLRWIGAAVFIGIALHAVWLVVPSFGVNSLGSALLGIGLTMLLFVLWLRRFGIRWHRMTRENATATVQHG